MKASEALNVARARVSVEYRKGAYFVRGPSDVFDIESHPSEVPADTREHARKIAAIWRAKCAAALVGSGGSCAFEAIEKAANDHDVTIVRELLNEAISARRAQSDGVSYQARAVARTTPFAVTPHNIRATRESLGISAEDASGICRLDRRGSRLWEKWESGEEKPSAELWELCLLLLDRHPDYQITRRS